MRWWKNGSEGHRFCGREWENLDDLYGDWVFNGFLILEFVREFGDGNGLRLIERKGGGYGDLILDRSGLELEALMFWEEVKDICYVVDFGNIGYKEILRLMSNLTEYG